MTAGEDVKVPDVDRCRQAVSSIRGYVYQLYASALAWTRLGTDEALLLEIAEDYAVVARDALAMVQVKDTVGSGTVTLRTPGVVASIEALWRYQQENSGVRVTCEYLTTSLPGREKGSLFPIGITGLQAWRDGAREGADIAALRELLATLPLEAPVKAWIAALDDETLRQDLLQRIHWHCGQPDLAGLDNLLADRLTLLAESLNLLPADAKAARPAVLHRLMLAVVDPHDRCLTRAQLLDVFTGAATSTISNTVLRQMMSALAQSGGAAKSVSVASSVDAAAVPRPPLSVERPGYARTLRDALATHRFLWVHGSNGAGKTSACLDIARARNARWKLAEMRDLALPAARELIRDLRATTLEPNFGGLILDDFPTELVHGLRLELSLLCQAIFRVDGALILTASRAPTPSLTLALQEPTAIVTTPRLDEAEVIAIVERAGGDAAFWARPILLACGGHPQLVTARVSGLKQRGWPVDQQLQGILPDDRAIDVDLEREAVRNRLLFELDERPRALLYRLSLTLGGFDRRTAVVIGEANPALAMAGDAFDFLVGPWIESSRPGRFRVSPLVAGAGTAALSEAETRAVHTAICDHFTTMDPFPGEDIGQLLASGLVAQHSTGLSLLIALVMTVDDEHRFVLARQLAHMVYFRTDQPILPGLPRLSHPLRFAQLKVAVILGEVKRSRSIRAALLAETAEDPVGLDFATGSAFTLLGGDDLEMDPVEWFPLVRELEAAAVDLSPETRAELSDGTGLDGDQSLAQFMFVWRSIKLTGVAQLQTLFDMLDRSDPVVRTRYLSALGGPAMTRRTVIQQAWTRDADLSDFDPIPLVQRYSGLEELAITWGDHDLALECVAAQSSLLSEYANDQNAALGVLDGAETRWPGEFRLARERTKILFRLGRHDEVKAVTPTFIDQTDPIERAHALRELAVSTAKTGDLPEAARLFASAADGVLAIEALSDMRAGLLGDQAFAEFEMGEPGRALQTLVRAARETDAMDRDAPRGGFVIRMLAGLATYIAMRLIGGESDPTVAMVVGACSGVPPTQAFDRPVPYKSAIWYQIGAINRALGARDAVNVEVQSHVASERLGVFEASIVLSAFADLPRLGDVDHFVAGLVAVGQVQTFARGLNTSLTEASLQQPSAHMPWHDVVIDLADLDIRAALEDAVIAFLAWSVVRAEPSPVDALAAALEAGPLRGLSTMLATWTGSVTDQMTDVGQTLGAVRVLQLPPGADASALFVSSFRLWEWLGRSSFARQIESQLLTRLAVHWSYIMTEASFALRSPFQTLPPIRREHNAMTDRAGLARLLLVADGAMRTQLGAAARQSLRDSLA